jgi:DNA-directed RNA polymerase specialized sigma24 family protein
MTIPGEQHRNQSRQVSDNGARAAEAAERIAVSHAQTRELRERTRELVHDLRGYVSYELGRRVRMGQIDAEDLLRDEVIDSVFAAAMTRLGQGHAIRDLRAYMRNRAQEMIQRETRRIQMERRQHVSLEQTLAPSGDSEDGEEVLVADVIPDPNAREPEDIVVNNEMLQFVIDALADVPDLWRTVFLQRTMQERSAREVADREQLDIDEVRRITVRTRDYLRERFEDEYEFLDDLFDYDE